jgi:hypothetical protein
VQIFQGVKWKPLRDVDHLWILQNTIFEGKADRLEGILAHQQNLQTMPSWFGWRMRPCSHETGEVEEGDMDSHCKWGGIHNQARSRIKKTLTKSKLQLLIIKQRGKNRKPIADRYKAGLEMDRPAQRAPLPSPNAKKPISLAAMSASAAEYVRTPNADTAISMNKPSPFHTTICGLKT